MQSNGPFQVFLEIGWGGRNEAEKIASLLLLDILMIFRCWPWVVSLSDCASSFMGIPGHVSNHPVFSFASGPVRTISHKQSQRTYTSDITGNGRAAEFAERTLINVLATSKELMMIWGSPRMPRLRDMIEPVILSDYIWHCFIRTSYRTPLPIYHKFPTLYSREIVVCFLQWAMLLARGVAFLFSVGKGPCSSKSHSKQWIVLKSWSQCLW